MRTREQLRTDNLSMVKDFDKIQTVTDNEVIIDILSQILAELKKITRNTSRIP